MSDKNGNIGALSIFLYVLQFSIPFPSHKSEKNILLCCNKGNSHWQTKTPIFDNHKSFTQIYLGNYNAKHCEF